LGKLRERDHLGDQGAEGTIILKRIFMKLYLGVQNGSYWLRIVQVNAVMNIRVA